MKSNFIIIFSVFTLAFVFCMAKPTWGQCDFKVEYAIKDGNDIYLTLDGIESSFTLKLYDLYKGKFIREKEYTFKNNNPALIFENVPSSTYAIQVVKSNCHEAVTLGGISGISIINGK